MGVVLMRSGAMDDARRRAILWLLGKCRVRLRAVGEQHTFALSLSFVPRKHGRHGCERSRFATSVAEGVQSCGIFSGIAIFDDIVNTETAVMITRPSHPGILLELIFIFHHRMIEPPPPPTSHVALPPTHGPLAPKQVQNQRKGWCWMKWVQVSDSHSLGLMLANDHD